MSSELFVSRIGCQTWAALREDGALVELRVEGPDERDAVGRVVKARVSKVLAGIQSAFLDIGHDRDAYLPGAELVLPGERRPTAPIEDRLREGREILVQVERTALASKGPRVTGRVNLPGRYLVYAPYAQKHGVSRRIHDADERARLLEILERLPAPGGGFIVRSAGAGGDETRFLAEAAGLVSVWSSIQRRFGSARAPSVLHTDLDLPLRLLRDAPRDALERMVVDDPEVHRRAVALLRDSDPIVASRVQLHTGSVPIFEAFGLEKEIERALRPKVWLRSGGYLIIEQTEALVSIDVNTGKFVGRRLLADTVVRTNLEAARETARQIRLRNLGGIIVVDFIQMDGAEERAEVLAALEEAIRGDRARIRTEGMSCLGLVQLTREKSRRSLEATITRPCPTCGGRGRVKSPETVASEALGEISRVLVDLDDRALTVRVHPDVARRLEAALGGENNAVEPGARQRVRIVADPEIHPDHFDVLAL